MVWRLLVCWQGAQGPFQHIISFSVHPSLVLLLSRGSCGVGLAASQIENSQIAEPDCWISQDTELQVSRGSHLNIAFDLSVTSTRASRANSEAGCFPCQCDSVVTYIFVVHLNSHCLITDSQLHSLLFLTQRVLQYSVTVKAVFQFNQITNQFPISLGAST